MRFRKLTDLRKISGVYAIAFETTDKKYIGSSVDVYKRIQDHLRDLRRGTHHSPLLQNSFNKYGEKDLYFCLMEDCAPDQLKEIEQIFIDCNGTLNANPSAKIGGACPNREALSRATKAAWDSGRMQGRRGKPHSAATKSMMSEARTAYWRKRHEQRTSHKAT